MPIMTSTPTPHPRPLWKVRTGYALSGVVALFLLLDATMKLIEIPIVLETTAELGWPIGSVRPLGLVLLLLTALYVLPRTSLLGAILLTGYLGGAVATHARVASPLLSHTLFGVYVGALAWAGLYLRDERLRALLPFADQRRT
jgi:hypothetical protein